MTNQRLDNTHEQAPKLFDINDELLAVATQQHSIQTDELEEKDISLQENEDFHDLVEELKKHFESIYTDDQLNSDEQMNRQELEHRAILGDATAEEELVGEIDNYLREHNLLGTPFPNFFSSLAEAIFHEIYRFGVFYKWQKYPKSPSAKIQGRELRFKINGKLVKQKEQLREGQVWEIIRAFKVSSRGLKINENNPNVEIDIEDGVRVSITIPPRTNEPTIVFRRFIVNQFSFLEQEKYDTIPKQDLYFYQTLSKLMLNTIISGGVESGKSTFLKTVFSARDEDLSTILIESTKESYLKRDFPERDIQEFYTNSSDPNEVIYGALRIDHDFIIFQEVRGKEAEGAISAAERGRNGLLMTYHITNPRKTIEQLARHIIDAFPNRKYVNEARRIAGVLDIGITMETFENNEKRVTSVYEICYNHDRDEAWINYLIKYDPETKQWYYNDQISDELREKMKTFDAKNSTSYSDSFINHLKQRTKDFPIKEECQQKVYFKE